MIPRVKTLRGLRQAPRGVSALLVVAMLLFAYTCRQPGGAACAGPLAGMERSQTETAVDHDGCADHGDGSADHDGCDGTHGDCRGSSICCSTWAPAPATITLHSPPALPVAHVATESLLQPDAAFVPAPAPIPRASPPHLVSILRL